MTTRGRDATSDPPYIGPLGETRHDGALVTGPDGIARRVDVVRAVNVATHPNLALAAIAGSLHRMDDGTDLAVPYVFHDPGARRFALVVPRARAHEELALRAELLLKLAGETTAPVPAYVREARTAVGPEGLRKLVEEVGEARGLDTRAEQIAQREERLRERAEDVTRREDELQQRAEELEVEKGDLAVREQELEQRLADLLGREEALTGEERAMRANISAQQSRERLLETREREISTREGALEARERELRVRERDAALRERDLDAREVDLDASLTPRLETVVSVSPEADGPGDDGGNTTPIKDHGSFDAEALEAEEFEAADGESLEAGEPVDEPTPLPAKLPVRPLAAVAPPAARRAEPETETETVVQSAPVAASPAAAPAPAPDTGESEEAVELSPDDSEDDDEDSDAASGDKAAAAPLAPTVPPAWVAKGHGGYAAVVEGEVRLWASGRAESAGRLGSGTASLVLQADPDSALPLALLSVLVGDDETAIARAVLDVTRPEDRAVLESLTRDFRVRLEVISSTGRALGSYPVGGPGEANAQRALAVLSARDAGAEDARRAAAEQLENEGVQSADGATFERTFGDESRLATAAGASEAAEAYAPLIDPAARERLVMARGIPAARLDALGKRVILAALRCGVLLAPPLVQHAQAIGIAADERALLARAITAFARTCDAGLPSIGRTRSEALRAWEALLAWAERAGAPVPEPAYVAMRAVFDIEDPAATPPPDPRPAPGADAIGNLSDEELPRWAEHPKVRDMVAREMLRRDPVRFAETLSRATRLLPVESAVELAAEMLRAGDALGDVWVELLGSRRPNAPAMATVATAMIHLRRGLNPVVHHALARENAEWKLSAWAAGEFGASVVRATARLESVDPERLAWVLAHAIRTGAGRDVEKLRTGSPGPLADAAARATGIVDDVRAYDAALRQGPGGTDAERVAHRLLSRVATRDNESLSARAPEGV